MKQKNRFYFSHDYNSRNDPKLQELLMDLGYEGLGIFWCLVEMLYAQDGYLLLDKCERYAFALRTESEKIKKVIEIAFKNDEKQFWSDTVLERLEIRKIKSNKAKESAITRWNNANAMRTQSDGNAIKERKGKERKGNIYINIYDINEIQLQEIAEKYSVPIAFVHSKYDDMINWHKSTGKQKKDWIATLRNFVKKDALNIRKEHDAKSRLAIISE